MKSGDTYVYINGYESYGCVDMLISEHRVLRVELDHVRILSLENRFGHKFIHVDKLWVKI